MGPDGNSDPSPQQFTSELRPQKIPALLLSSGDCLFFSLRSLCAHAHTCVRMHADMLSVCVYVCVYVCVCMPECALLSTQECVYPGSPV